MRLGLGKGNGHRRRRRADRVGGHALVEGARGDPERLPLFGKDRRLVDRMHLGGAAGPHPHLPWRRLAGPGAARGQHLGHAHWRRHCLHRQRECQEIHQELAQEAKARVQQAVAQGQPHQPGPALAHASLRPAQEILHPPVFGTPLIRRSTQPRRRTHFRHLFWLVFWRLRTNQRTSAIHGIGRRSSFSPWTQKV